MLATQYWAEALQAAIQVKQAQGQKAHSWLAQRQLQVLLETRGSDVEGQPDRLVLRLLVTAGLRREEAANLHSENLKRQPVGVNFRVVPASEARGQRIERYLSLTRWPERLGNGGRLYEGSAMLSSAWAAALSRARVFPR